MAQNGHGGFIIISVWGVYEYTSIIILSVWGSRAHWLTPYISCMPRIYPVYILCISIIIIPVWGSRALADPGALLVLIPPDSAAFPRPGDVPKFLRLWSSSRWSSWSGRSCRSCWSSWSVWSCWLCPHSTCVHFYPVVPICTNLCSFVSLFVQLCPSLPNHLCSAVSNSTCPCTIFIVFI